MPGMSAACACRAPKEETDYLYLIGSKYNNWYKIGVARSPKSRLRSFNVPFELRLLRTVPVKGNRKFVLSIENALHKIYASHKIKGEWFWKIDPDDFVRKAEELL